MCLFKDSQQQTFVRHTKGVSNDGSVLKQIVHSSRGAPLGVTEDALERGAANYVEIQQRGDLVVQVLLEQGAEAVDQGLHLRTIVVLGVRLKDIIFELQEFLFEVGMFADIDGHDVRVAAHFPNRWEERLLFHIVVTLQHRVKGLVEDEKVSRLIAGRD